MEGLTEGLLAQLEVKLRSPEYLECLKEGAQRMRLDGSPGVGVVSHSEEASARKKRKCILLLKAAVSEKSYLLTNFTEYLQWDSAGLKTIELILDTPEGRLYGNSSPKRLRAIQRKTQEALSANRFVTVSIRKLDFHRAGYHAPMYLHASRVPPKAGATAVGL